MALYKHEIGERRHPSGHLYLDPRLIGPFLERTFDDLLVQRVLRMMLDEGVVETFAKTWVFRISDTGLREADALAHGVAQVKVKNLAASTPVKLPKPRIVIDWAKWGSIASIVAIPVALIIWWLS